jgi:hypothetical protein
MFVRGLVVTAILAVLVSGCGSNGGPFNPGQNDDARFYPLAVGNTWEYTRYGTFNIDSLSYTISGASTVTITGTADHSGGFQVFVEETMVSDTILGLFIETAIDTSYIRVTGSGLHGYPSLLSTDSSWTVPFPLITGMVWPFSTEPPMTGELLSQSETVTVPAGTFQDCLEMRIIWIEGGNVVNTSNFAPNVGMVRNIYSQGTAQFLVNITTRLASYQLAP